MFVYTLIYVLACKNSQFTKGHYLKKSKERCMGRFERRPKKEKMLLHYSLKTNGKRERKTNELLFICWNTNEARPLFVSGYRLQNRQDCYEVWELKKEHFRK